MKKSEAVLMIFSFPVSPFAELSFLQSKESSRFLGTSSRTPILQIRSSHQVNGNELMAFNGSEPLAGCRLIQVVSLNSRPKRVFCQFNREKTKRKPDWWRNLKQTEEVEWWAAVCYTDYWIIYCWIFLNLSQYLFLLILTNET